MALNQIMPAAIRYTKELCDAINAKKGAGLSCRAEEVLVRHLGANTETLYDAIDILGMD